MIFFEWCSSHYLAWTSMQYGWASLPELYWTMDLNDPMVFRNRRESFTGVPVPGPTRSLNTISSTDKEFEAFPKWSRSLYPRYSYNLIHKGGTLKVMGCYWHRMYLCISTSNILATHLYIWTTCLSLTGTSSHHTLREPELSSLIIIIIIIII